MNTIDTTMKRVASKPVYFPELELPPEFHYVDRSDKTFMSILNTLLNTDDNMVILGPGGSGKSLLIKIISKLLKNVAVCSTTGLSALNITQNGTVASTVHSFFKLKPIAVFNKESFHENPKTKELLDTTKTLVIDESSMLSSHLFDVLIENMLIYRKAYGNLPRLILFGDILQLPPVIDSNNDEIRKFYQQQYNNKKMFFNGAFYGELGFKVFNLTKIYRQDNVEQQALLNRIRDSSLTYTDLKTINQQVIPLEKYEEMHKHFIHMTPVNKTVSEINQRYVESFKGEPHKYIGNTTGLFEVEKMNMEYEVILKNGIQIMTLFNQYGYDDPEAHYRNGLMGEITSCEDDYAWAEMENGDCTKILRETSIQYGYYSENGSLQHKAIGSFTQIGCKPLKALTIHKSQGKTLEKAYLTLGSWMPEALIYVALSRLTDLNNLGLNRPIMMQDIKANQESIDFLERVL